VLANLLPGLRELRAPLAAGYVWLLAGWIALEPHVDSDDSRVFSSLLELGDVASAIGLGVATSFAAYLVGLLSIGSLTPLLRRLRPGLAPKSEVAARNHVTSTLQRIDGRVTGTATSLRQLVAEETPESGGTLVDRVYEAVVNEFDLIRTRLLDKKPDLFSDADRHRAEAEFRLGVAPAVAILAVAVLVASFGDWIAFVAAGALVVAALGLAWHGLEATRAAGDVLVLVLTDGHVQSPTLERLEDAAKRLTPDIETDPPRPRREQVVTAMQAALGSAVVALRESPSDPTAAEGLASIAERGRDQIARVPVYMQPAPPLENALESADALLHLGADRLRQSTRLDEGSVAELEQRVGEIERLAAGEIAEPGLYEELVADLDRVSDALHAPSPVQRGLAVHALGTFLTADRHADPRAAVALLAQAARSSDPDVRAGAMSLFEREASTGISDHLTAESWEQVDFAGLRVPDSSLGAIDFRDAVLENADFSHAHLDGAQLHNASLKRARLNEANLTGAVLEYTDLAEATLEDADLSRATLVSPLVAGLRLARARLTEATFDPAEIPWHLTVGWRDAELSPEQTRAIEEFAGALPEGPRILMLMWEVPPLVAGGSWTACYHLIRRLRARGADVTVVVPWRREICEEHPFAMEVDVVHLGIDPIALATNGVSSFQEGIYSFTALEAGSYSPYNLRTPTQVGGPYGVYGVYGAYGATPELVPVVDEFAHRLAEWPRLDEFELLHAQDWVTFPAAQAAAGGRPWIAHFHSTASERHAGSASAPVWETDIELRGAASADLVLTPSARTSAIVRDMYDVDAGVAPNPLSRDAGERELGRFDTKRVVFLGRMTTQKGPDRFVDIARKTKVRVLATDWSFVAFGDGDERERLASEAGKLVDFRAGLPWSMRAEAFRGASAIVVPSRAEPFGMVVAEAMESGVPVLYPKEAGITEHIDLGSAAFGPDESLRAADLLYGLLRFETGWTARVKRQRQAIEDYRAAQHEDVVLSAWEELLSRTFEPLPAA
jgi:glycosyltransferase involved in cell wall biosynthesis